MTDFRHKNTFFPHNFRGNPGTTLASIPARNIMNPSRIQESSSGKSPIGDKPLRFIPSATALSLINFSHKNTVFPQNFRGNPGTTLASIPAQDIVKKQHKEKKSSSGKSPIGRQAFNGHIPSAEFAVSVI